MASRPPTSGAGTPQPQTAGNMNAQGDDDHNSGSTTANTTMTQNTSGGSSTLGVDAAGRKGAVPNHWTSPAELLEMRTLWTAISRKYEEDILSLKQALQRARAAEENALRELADTARLRQLYQAAKVEHERMQRAQRAWAEERIGMLQELERLRLLLASSSSGSSSGPAGSSSSGRTPGSREGTPGSTSTNGSVGLQGLLRAAQGENIILHEALTRRAMEQRELESRLLLNQSTAEHSLATARGEASNRTAECQRLRASVASMREELGRRRREAETAAEGRRAAELEAQRAVAEAEELRAELARVRAEAIVEQQQKLEDIEAKLSAERSAEMRRMADEIKDMKMTLTITQEAAASATRMRNDILASAERERAQAERQIAEAESSKAAAQHEVELVRRAAAQEVEDIKDRLAHAAQARQDVVATCEVLRSRLDAIVHSETLARAELDRARADAQRERATVEELRIQLMQATDAAADAAALKDRLAALEQESLRQEQHHEQELQRHIDVITLLQKKHHQDTRALLDVIGAEAATKAVRKAKLKARANSSPDSVSSANGKLAKAKCKGGESGGRGSPEKRSRSRKRDARKEHSSPGRSHSAAQVTDAVEMIRANAIAAERCCQTFLKF